MSLMELQPSSMFGINKLQEDYGSGALPEVRAWTSEGTDKFIFKYGIAF